MAKVLFDDLVVTLRDVPEVFVLLDDAMPILRRLLVLLEFDRERPTVPNTGEIGCPFRREVDESNLPAVDGLELSALDR